VPRGDFEPQKRSTVSLASDNNCLTSRRMALACPFRKSYPDVLVVQTSQDRNGDDGARALDCSMQGRIFL
jgi:hypothetical protein